MEQIMPNILKPRKLYIGQPTCAGDRYKINTKLSIDRETGEKIAEPGDKFDLDAEIQSYAASTDIVSIIERLQGGDTSVINVRQDGISGDLVNLPRDINAMQDNIGLSQTALIGFNKLSDDVKALFDNDPAKFFDAVITNKVDSIIANYKKAEETVAAEPEGENE